MKKTLFTALVLVLSTQVFGANAQDILRQARADYYKNLEKKPTVRVRKEKVVKTADGEKVVEVEKEKDGKVVEKYLDSQENKKPKPKTKMERLEYNAALATDKVDFYERVVRSVRREEVEVDGYNEMLGKASPKKVDINKSSSRKTVKKETNKTKK